MAHLQQTFLVTRLKTVIKNFIPFGIEAMVWQQTDNKLEPRAIRGTLLGRDPSSYGQFVKLHKKNKVISDEQRSLSGALDRARRQKRIQLEYCLNGVTNSIKCSDVIQVDEYSLVVVIYIYILYN